MPRKPAKKRPPKNVDNPGKNSGVLVPQPHGGALKRGGVNPGGGRPPNVVRSMLLHEAVEGVPMLRDVLAGQPIKRASIPLSAVLRHATCPDCGQKLQRKADAPDASTPAQLITIEGVESASPGDRVRAWESFARYGIGTKDEVSVVSPDVRLRLERTVQLIAQQESWTSEDLLARLDAIWSTED